MKAITCLAAAFLLGPAGQAFASATAPAVVTASMHTESSAPQAAAAPAPGYSVASFQRAERDESSARQPVPRTGAAQPASIGWPAFAEPPDWVLLLCGFVVVVFMAQRKASLLP